MKNLEQRVKELEEENRNYRRTIRSLNRKVQRRDRALEVHRQEKLFLIRHAYWYLGELAWTVLTTRSPEAVYARALDLLKDIDMGTRGRKRLAGFLEKHLNIKSKYLSVLKEEEITVFRFLVIGFKPALISLLTGVKTELLYTRKNRLIGKIRKRGSKRAVGYLDLLP